MLVGKSRFFPLAGDFIAAVTLLPENKTQVTFILAGHPWFTVKNEGDSELAEFVAYLGECLNRTAAAPPPEKRRGNRG